MKKNSTKKRIAILTFSRAHNYGSILQAYALQRYILEHFNCSCEIVDFSNLAQKEMYSVFKKELSIKNLIKNAVAVIGYKKLKNEYDDFENFIEKNLILTKKTYIDSAELKEISDSYDIFITGSDQIWNITCPDADDAYYLDFLERNDVKRIAYAPSFGARNLLIHSDNPKKYEKLLKKYDYLSIREVNGQKWIKELIKKEVPLLIDPTLFYSPADYQSIMSQKLVDSPFILYYAFVFNKEAIKTVYEISKKYNLSVVILSSYAYIYKFCWKYGFKLAKHSSPAEFLRLVNDATMVFSTSFHGTLFSALFKKNFWFLYGSIQDKNDDRALTLVRQLGIEDRVLKIEDVPKTDLLEKPDYSQMDDRISKLRKKAFDFLEQSING